MDDFEGNEETLNGYLSLMHGNPPVYETFVTPEEKDKFIIEKLNLFIIGESIQPDEICICDRTNSSLDEIKKSLNIENIKYLDLSSYKQNINAVNVSTFHNMKGHEFKTVFEKGMSESTVPFKHSKYAILTEKERTSYN